MVIASKSSLPIPTIFNPRPPTNSHSSQCSSLLISSHLSTISILSTKRCKLYLNSPPHINPSSKSKKIWKISATAQSLKLAEVAPVESSEQIVTTSGDGVSNIISVLLFLAFVGLSVLTIGVIYIAVTDYLQKKEREKFEKEESGKKKKANKKKKVRARAGPRGFGQKIDEVDDDDDD